MIYTKSTTHMLIYSEMFLIFVTKIYIRNERIRTK